MNTDYKCPYCSKEFLNWKSVQGHLNRCKINTNDYRICHFYGPIHINTINKYFNTVEFRKDYPNTTFNSQFWKRLRNSGKTDLRKKIEWTKDSIICAIQSFYTHNNRIPQAREFIGDYPNSSTVCNYFGFWNKAIEAAGYVADYHSYGAKTLGKDGFWYMSKAEAYFVNKYLYDKYSYEYEPKYKNNKWWYDFYIKELDLYIEIAGGLDNNRIEEKIIFNHQNNINCRVIAINDLYTSSIDLVG